MIDSANSRECLARSNRNPGEESERRRRRGGRRKEEEQGRRYRVSASVLRTSLLHLHRCQAESPKIDRVHTNSTSRSHETSTATVFMRYRSDATDAPDIYCVCIELRATIENHARENDPSLRVPFINAGKFSLYTYIYIRFYLVPSLEWDQMISSIKKGESICGNGCFD